MPSVLTATNFDVNNVTFGKHKPNTNGGYNIELTIGDSTNETLIQSPKMRAPFGIGTDKTNPFKKSLDISFQGQDTSDSIKAFRAVMEKMDNIAIDYALKNSKTFFNSKKELTRDIIEEYYCSGIKKSKREEYSDTFRFKLQFLKPNPDKNLPNGKYLTSFWDPKGEEKNENYLDKGDSITALIKPQMFWVASKQFGITWVCTQVRVHKQQKICGYAFKKTTDDDDPKVGDSEEEEIEVEESEEEVEVEVDA
jgi:hypothetical protein